MRSTLSLVLIGVLSAAGARLTAASVSTLDGQTFSGDELVLSAAGIAVGGRTVAFADADTLLLNGKPPVLGSSVKFGVWLADGGWLPATAVSAAAAPDQVTVSGPLGALVLPLAALRGWGAATLPGRAGANDDQVLVAGSLLAGTVQGVRDGKLVVQSSLDQVQLDLKDVLGLRLGGSAPAAKGLTLAATLDPTQPALRLLPRPELPLASAPTVSLASVLGGVALRVDGGRRVYLGALKPSTVEEIGAFGTVWPFRVDANLDGSALSIHGVRYAHGVVVHSQARLVWTLGGGYARLKAAVGISDLVAPEGDCAATLSGDGKVLWTKANVRGGDVPTPLDLDLTGVSALELRVDYGARYDIGDHLALADAWLLRK